MKSFLLFLLLAPSSLNFLNAQTPLFASIYYCENIYCRETHLVLYPDSTVIFSKGPRSTEQQLYKAKLSPIEFRSLVAFIDSCKPEIMKLKDRYRSTDMEHCGSELFALFEKDEKKVIWYCPYSSNEPPPAVLMSIREKMSSFTITSSQIWHPDSIEVTLFPGRDKKHGCWPKSFPPLSQLTITKTKKNSSWYETYFPYEYLPSLEKHGKKLFTYKGRETAVQMRLQLPGEKTWRRP